MMKEFRSRTKLFSRNTIMMFPFSFENEIWEEKYCRSIQSFINERVNTEIKRKFTWKMTRIKVMNRDCRGGCYEPLKKSNLLVHSANLSISHWEKNLCYATGSVERQRYLKCLERISLKTSSQYSLRRIFPRNIPRIFSDFVSPTALTFTKSRSTKDDPCEANEMLMCNRGNYPNCGSSSGPNPNNAIDLP